MIFIDKFCVRLSLRLLLYQKRIATSNVATVGEIVEVLSYFHFYPSARVWELELLYFTLLQGHQLNKLINFANNFMICNHMQLYVKAVEADLNMLNMPSLRNQLLPMYRMRTETLLHYEHRFFREYF